MIELLNDEPAFVPDVYFARGYGQVDAAESGGTWSTIADPDGTWQMPVVINDLGDGLREATSPYGYSGIHVADRELTTADQADRWNAARELLMDLHVVSVFLRFSPFDPTSATTASGFEGLDIRRSGTTYMVEIGAPSTLWDGLESSCRNKVRKAERHGLTGSVRPVAMADVEPGSDFRRLYEGTMARVGASDRYSFDEAYYRGLAQALGEGLQLVEVHDAKSVVASSLLMRHEDRVHYHLSGSDPEGARNGANVMLIWSMLEWCAKSGVSWCHLGGGRVEGDGLATFKRSFGGRASDFHVGSCVVDQGAYARLSQERADQLGTTPDALKATGFFPAFRAGPEVS